MSSAATRPEKDQPLVARRSIRVLQKYNFELAAAERDRLSAIANKLLCNEPALCSTMHFGSKVNCGLHVQGPALLFADQSEISLYDVPEEGFLEYRMAMLGETGDMLVLSHDRSEAFEAYLHDYLDIGGLDVLTAASLEAERHWPLPKRCLQSDELFQQIAEKARNTGLLSIIPYLSTGHVWNLARRVAEETGADVALAAPPPRLAKRINDKIWFANRVKQVLGRTALSPAFTVYGAAALAGYVRRLASKTERLVIKIPDSAGSSGNLSLDASVYRGRSPAWIKAQLLQLLATLGWTGAFPLKVEAWETPVLSSPSAQIWIPHRRDGPPVVEGLFEQVVEGAGGTFVGAIKSRMPPAWQKRMAEQAMKMAYMFQRLGYFGRCSFDALVTGTNYNNCKLHWIECNGRWGGVSVPMTLMNRVLADSSHSQIMIVQNLNLRFPAEPFETAIDAVSDLLFQRSVSLEGIILLTPTGYERGIGVHFMAIGRTLDQVRELSHRTQARLTKR